jgi:hypothetical protein
MAGSTLTENTDLEYDLISLCYTVGEAFIDGRCSARPDSEHSYLAVTPQVVDSYIPGQVLNVAVGNELLPEPPQVDDGLQLGEYRVTPEYRVWFLKLIDFALSDFRETAERNMQRFREWSDDVARELGLKDAPRTSVIQLVQKCPAAIKVDEYLRLAREQHVVFYGTEIVKKASRIRRTLDNGTITDKDLSVMYHGGYVGPVIREAFAVALGELVPCSAEDLLPRNWVTGRRRRVTERK